MPLPSHLLCFSRDEPLRETCKWILDKRFQAVAVSRLRELSGRAVPARTSTL